MPSGTLLFKRGRDKVIVLSCFKDAIGTQYVEREQARKQATLRNKTKIWFDKG